MLSLESKPFAQKGNVLAYALISSS